MNESGPKGRAGDMELARISVRVPRLYRGKRELSAKRRPRPKGKAFSPQAGMRSARAAADVSRRSRSYPAPFRSRRR